MNSYFIRNLKPKRKNTTEGNIKFQHFELSMHDEKYTWNFGKFILFPILESNFDIFSYLMNNNSE